MAFITSPSLARPWPRVRSRHAVGALVLLACAAFMFFDVRTTPIVRWDESRMAVNALEMHLSGRLRLVTTYGFQPDLWNTKPPLLIWLMDLSMSVFGVSEWSVRLPSELASLGTLALVMSFTRRVTRSPWASALGAVLLTLSVLFFSEHGARTADYDALLCFLTTAYLYVLFFALHRREPGLGRPLIAAALVSLAIMTKSIAGVLPGIGVPLYLLLVGRWRRPLQQPWYAVFGALALVGPAAFATLREQAAPGYLKAALFNDASGRFGKALDKHTGPPWYYLQAIIADGGFSGGYFAALSPLALLRTRGRARLGLLYCLCIAGGLLTVLTLGATKLTHYAMSALPFVAILTSIAAHEAARALAEARSAGRLETLSARLCQGLVAALLLLTFGRALYIRAVWLTGREFESQSLYGELLHDLARRGFVSPRIVDGGVIKPWVTADGIAHDYAPQLDFYRLQMNAEGMRAVRIPTAALTSTPSGALVATCDPDFAGRVQALGPNLTSVVGCIAARRR